MTDSESSQLREREIRKNLSEVLEIVNQKKQRDARLVVVSKTKPASDILHAYNAGHRHFGENYVGTRACGKIKREIPNLWAVETIDGQAKAKKMNDAWVAAGNKNTLNAYVQVNTSGEANKGGVEPQDLIKTLEYIRDSCSGLNLKGIMTIGSIENSGTIPNPDFLKASELRGLCQQELDIPLEVSMGMSDDFEHALEVGSDSVRVGSKIVGKRNYSKHE
ncbi:hypothetical protein BB560_001647 [Smittium megazygosporum]|uniref:Uncharacterized protein n=1 Tax=Smittium megazygosporum TaxID=133381 RepID=A0A2T9ZH16_9FUNG|nr:hypothetical protein BB560_001647 [Smittium megazygosporum]